jgi:hypothetical protein
MSLQKIQGNYLGIIQEFRASRKKASEERSLPEKPFKEIKDSYEPSDPEEREKNIDAVKRKISSGYYNSDEVNEDLSSMLAKIFSDSA